MILAALVAELREARFKATDVKRRNAGDVRSRCELAGCSIELILDSESSAEETQHFLLLASDFSRLVDPATVEIAQAIPKNH